jgi:cobalamin biosynthesis Mg chelatase CobN
MRVALLALLLACTKRVDTATTLAVEAHAEQASASDTDTVERSTRTAGPVDVVTVTEVFGPVAVVEGDAKGADGGSGNPTVRPAPTVPPGPILVKRITRTEHRGPVEAVRERASDAVAASSATQASKTTASTQTHSVSAPAWHIPLWGLAALALIGLALYLFKRLP